MSAYSMKPKFTDLAGYQNWHQQWRMLYGDLSMRIRRNKLAVKALQRSEESSVKSQKALLYERAMAAKLMMLLGEAKDRWKRILAMKQQIIDQNATFPLTLEGCRTIDIHWNVGSKEFSDLPMWILKARGKIWYINHMDSDCPWSTRETPDASTKGSLRFKDCSLHIAANGHATISKIKLAVCCKALEPGW